MHVLLLDALYGGTFVTYDFHNSACLLRLVKFSLLN